MLYYIIDEIQTLLLDLEKQNYYGKVTLVFENGKINYIKKEETLKKVYRKDPKRKDGTKEDAVRDSRNRVGLHFLGIN